MVDLSSLSRTVLIVAAPGIWRDALVSLIRAQPQFQVIAILDTVADARDAFARQGGDVVIAENNADERSLLAFITWLHDVHSGVRCVVAVDTQIQQSRCHAAGAHATLLKGCLDEKLLRQALAM